MASRVNVYWVLTALALGTAGASAEETAKPAPKAQVAADTAPDEELLEFLGSLDAEDEEWSEYLAETDIAQVAKAKPAAQKSEVKKYE